MKVLAITFSIKPGHGSEYAVGWTWVKEIAQVADHVVVLARDAEGQKEAIEAELQLRPLPNVSFLFYELPGRLKNIVRGSIETKQFGMRRYYIVWQIFSYFFLRRVVNIREIDIVHHVTFENDWLPSVYPLLGARKIVLGPLGSHSVLPRSLGYSTGDMLLSWLAAATKVAFRWLNPLFRFNMIRADALIGISSDTRRKIGTKRLEHKFYHIPGVSIDEELKPELKHYPKTITRNDTVILLSAGVFNRMKNFDLTIEAFSQYQQVNSNSRLLIAGGGDLEASLRELAINLGISNSVIFLGWLKRHELLEILKTKAHIFVFPTAESGGTVSLEAVRCGVPVICLDGYGYSYFCKKPQGGIAVPVVGRDQVIRDIAKSVVDVLNKLPDYSRSAFEESAIFLPARKRELLERIYHS